MEINANYYFNEYNGTILQNDDTAQKAINQAFRQINILCRGRLNDIDNLPQKVQDAVKEIICEHADFNAQNSDLINSAFAEYKINNVTMKYQPNAQIAKVGGIFIKQMLYDELSFYGLTYRGL